MYRRFLTLILLGLCSISTFAKVSLPAIFGNGMVLQQQVKAAIWGKATKKSKVTLVASWDKAKYTAVADENGKWRTSIQTPSAGGPYTVTISDGEKLTLSNVLIGEVWVCSGQSNMVMPMKGFNGQPITNSNRLLVDATNDQLHLFDVGKSVSAVPLDTCVGSWQASTPEVARNFSAIGYQFGNFLQRKLNIPVGIIVSADGGTLIEAWTDEETNKAFPGANLILFNKADHNSASVLYNAMIHPIEGYSTKGFLWYQGESNRFNGALYEKQLPAMVSSWRTKWGQGDLPFYIVQIAPYNYNEADKNSPYLREAQLKASQSIPNSGIAIALDAGARWPIHPPDKTVLSERLAYMALTKNYNWKGFAAESPTFRTLKVDGSKATVHFNNAPNGITSFGKELDLFELAGDDKVFYPAKATIVAGTVELKSEKVTNPVAVRYAFKDWVVGNLFGTEGLPVSSFRSDSW